MYITALFGALLPFLHYHQGRSRLVLTGLSTASSDRLFFSFSQPRGKPYASFCEHNFMLIYRVKCQNTYPS